MTDDDDNSHRDQRVDRLVHQGSCLQGCGLLLSLHCYTILKNNTLMTTMMMMMMITIVWDAESSRRRPASIGLLQQPLLHCYNCYIATTLDCYSSHCDKCNEKEYLFDSKNIIRQQQQQMQDKTQSTKYKRQHEWDIRQELHQQEECNQ